MKKLLDLLSEELQAAFKQAGYDEKYGRVTISNRPDLCEFQCNGAMSAVKEYKKAPIMIANDVAAALADNAVFAEVSAVNPGFLNLKLSDDYLADYLQKMNADERHGLSIVEKQRTIMVDYGGPNVAKPLHVGHLRSAIIGESVKRICRYMGHKVVGDIHLGDWGLQMGLIITELKKRQPELPYFDETFTGEYPKEAPFTISELEEIYPTASAKSKEDEAYKEEAMNATFLLQNGNRGYTALWNHIMAVSKADLKKNYANLNVEFDLWKGEADVQKYIPDMVARLRNEGFAYESEGALVVDVKEDTDTKEIPPCMILKSDGASLYTTTDLATLVERKQDINPDGIIYVVDKRQDLHFVQVFRCAKKVGIIGNEVDLNFIGFGTMNGKDGKPFKTREGGVMRLENLLADIDEEMYRKIVDNHEVEEAEARATAKIVALAAVKYGDLSNQATKDYVFDIDKFTSFEGNTGPYILYTIVRIKSILNKYIEQKSGNVSAGDMSTISGADVIGKAASDCEKALMLSLAQFNAVIEGAYEETAPHKICAFIYELANTFNRFYHETKILAEEDEKQQASWIALLNLTKKVLETSIDLLGFAAPERM
ncbi:MAG TPA: arginine--tRNA ligase [Lachnospiraceae bacterium]|nr:arginine--tRNA ligase [Lachnospiraceae bacterium]